MPKTTENARKIRWWMYAGGALVVALGAVAAVIATFAAPRYAGPVSDHFDGHEFRNVGPFAPRGFREMWKWKTSGGAAAWPAWVDGQPAPAPARRVSQGVVVTFVNHATWLVQLGGVNVLTDPVWSTRVGPFSWAGAKRHRPPGVRFEDLPPIDAVVVSHNHYDHLDVPTLARLEARDGPQIFVGLGTRRLLAARGLDAAHVVDLDWWQSADVRGVRVTFAPAQHWTGRGVGDRNGNLWGSYVIAAGDDRVYFAGDTGAGPHFAMVRQRLGAPLFALLPIGSYEPRWFMHPQHLNPADALAAHAALGARRSLGMHFGTFDMADEGIDDPPRALAEARRQAGVAEDAFVAARNGERFAAPSSSRAR